MNEKRTRLHRFFSEKAKHLQNEIELEIEKIGGEEMLTSRIDLIHWVYSSRKDIEVYHTICRMLDDRTEDTDTARILQELRETMEYDRTAIDRLQRKHEEEEKALNQLREEAEYYRQTLDVLGA